MSAAIRAGVTLPGVACVEAAETYDMLALFEVTRRIYGLGFVPRTSNWLLLVNQLSVAVGLSFMISACASVQTTLKPPITAPGPDFLVRNAAARGVVTTSSGLQYFIVRSGPKTGRNPATRDTVRFDYEGRLVTGEIFDSSYERRTPLIGTVGEFAPGLAEALKLMRPGDEWIVWVPPALGHGDRGSGSIPADSVLQFRVALHSVTPVLNASPVYQSGGEIL